MAYWRNYRKLTSEVEALAATDSSEDDNIHTVNIPNCTNELSEPDNCSSSDSCHDFSMLKKAQLIMYLLQIVALLAMLTRLLLPIM